MTAISRPKTVVDSLVKASDLPCPSLLASRQRMHQEALFFLVSLELEDPDSIKTKQEQTIKCTFTGGHD